mgnify:CR=1 FL=1
MLNNNLFNAEQLALIADIMQIANYVENLQQTSNDRILQELERQNKVYLEEILKRLERLENAQVNDKIQQS